jgi:hypothetical protein
MRLDEPQKEMRRRSVVEGETNEKNLVPGASGKPRQARKRPGRAASLLSIGNNTRSQKWRNPEKGSPAMRRGNLAKGSRTGRNRAK